MTVKAADIEGLRELIGEVIAGEGERLLPRGFLADVEEIKRSPVGAVIRMEGDINALKEGQEALWKGQETLRAEMREGQETLRAEMREGQEALRTEMREGQEALWKGQEALRAEMKEGLGTLRTEMKEGLGTLRTEMKEGRDALGTELRKEIAALKEVMNARFEGLEARLDQIEKRFATTEFWMKFFAGLVSALFIAQLILTYVK